MPTTHQPVALTPALPSSLLSYILTHQVHPITLLICQSRSAFLLSLQRYMPNTTPPQPPPPPSSNLAQEPPSSIPISDEELELMESMREHETANTNQKEKAEKHPLLTATLHQIATSRSINLVFTPTLSHFRAYIAVFPPPPSAADKKKPPEVQFDKPSRKPPLLVVYGLVQLHRDTSEWSAQGVGSSVANCVEAGKRAGRRIEFVEERAWDVRVGMGDGEGKRKTGWEERLPMLNGSVRRVGLESEDGGWSGRTVEIGRVLGRWCRFQEGKWDED